jgi:nucleoside-diphosphate-sugar epimerase
MTTLITGANGYLGARLATTLADRGEELMLTVRAAGTVVQADLRDPAAFDQVDPRRITRIVHTAAITRFDVTAEDARQVNVAGTARVRDFAARCPNLRRLVVLSTLYSAGRQTGEIAERRHPDHGFVNHYEWSKWAAEEEALAAPQTLVLRLPTVIADDRTGRVGRHNAFHHTLRLYFHGLLSLLPGDPSTQLPVATADWVTEAVVALLDAAPGIYQLNAGAVSLADAVDLAFAVFEDNPAFRRRMLARPVGCDLDSFRELASAARGLRGGPIEAALRTVAPFAEQLYHPKTFRTDRLDAAWPPERRPGTPDPRALVEATVTDLIGSR